MILLYFPLSLFYSLFFILIISEDYYSLLVEMVYSLFLLITSFQLLDLSTILTLTIINFVFITILMSLKAYISISMLVGNIIHIFMFALVIILISILLYLIVSGFSMITYLLYLFLTYIEFFLFILFFLESFSTIFQSVTLANRLSINLLSGSLLTYLISNSIIVLLFYIYLFFYVILLLLFIFVFGFEIFNCFIQLFIFILLNINYLF